VVTASFPRPAIAVTLLVSALKLVDVGATGLGAAVGASTVFFVVLAIVRRPRDRDDLEATEPVPGHVVGEPV
jgi:hypothetical protein